MENKEPSPTNAVLSPSASSSTAELPSGSSEAVGSGPQTAKSSLKDSLELGSKAILGLAGLCYVLGLVVVTLYLNRLGLNSLALSQLQYVMAGVWALLPIMLGMFLTIAVIYYASEELQKWRSEAAIEAIKAQAKAQQDEVKSKAATGSANHNEPPNGAASPITEKSYFARVRRFFSKVQRFLSYLFSKQVRQMAGTLVGAVFGFLFVLYLFSGWVGLQLSPWWLLALIAGAVVGWLGFFVGYSLRRRMSMSMTLGQFNEMVVGVFVCLLLFFGYAILFARTCFPDIPWSSGGGKASTVRFVIEPEASPYLLSLGVTPAKSDNSPKETKWNPESNLISDKLTLLMATDKELIILQPPDGHPVSIASGAVRFVLYEK